MAPLYNTSFNPVYKCVDWEIVLKNGNEIGKIAATVPVKIALASWTTTEP